MQLCAAGAILTQRSENTESPVCLCPRDGLRAGYMELVNVDPEVMRFVDTMLCTDISTPVTGQLALDLMVDPPRPGELSFDTYRQVRRLRRLVGAAKGQSEVRSVSARCPASLAQTDVIGNRPVLQ